MDSAYLVTINGYELAWALGILATWIAVGLLWLRLRQSRRRQALAQAEIARVRRSLETQNGQTLSLRHLIKRHLTHSQENRGRIYQLQRRLDNLEQQIWHADACRRAIGTARRGGPLKPLIKRGDLNSAEAHLIQVVHGPRRERARKRMKAG